MTPQTPPTDRPLTAGEPLWMVHVLGPDEIYPAPDHATAVQWCAGMNGAIPDSDVLCVAVPALWTGSSKDHAAGLKEARDDLSALARPATSAASEGLGVLERAKLASIVHMLSGMEPSNTVQIYGREAAIILAALASPPVSERERELEGALRRQADNMAFVLNHASLYAWHDKFVAELEEDRALLTAQPAGEGK